MVLSLHGQDSVTPLLIPPPVLVPHATLSPSLMSAHYMLALLLPPEILHAVVAADGIRDVRLLNLEIVLHHEMATDEPSPSHQSCSSLGIKAD